MENVSPLVPLTQIPGTNIAILGHPELPGLSHPELDSHSTVEMDQHLSCSPMRQSGIAPRQVLHSLPDS